MLPGISIARPGWGTGHNFGEGGDTSGFPSRGRPRGGPITGRDPRGDRAVAAALDWLARHQGLDGGWSLDYHDRCKDPSCTGVGDFPLRGRGHRPGTAALPGGGANAPVPRPLSESCQSRAGLAPQPPEADGRSLRGRIADVLARPGHDRAVRGLRHDRRQQASPAGPGGAALHRGRPGPGDRRLVVHASPAGRRHVGLRLAGDGPEERPDGPADVSPASLEQARKWLDGVGKGVSKGLFSYRPDVPRPTP